MINPKHFRCFGLILCVFLVSAIRAFPQSSGSPECEMILLELSVERTLVFDLDAWLCSEELYLPVSMFADLKIPFEYNPDKNVLIVRYPDSDNPVSIDFKRKKVESKSHSSGLGQGNFILDETGDYIRKDLIGDLMDMDIIFNYRDLSLLLFSNIKLPVIENYERKQRYKNFSESSREQSPDVTVPTKRHLLKGLLADWSLYNSHNVENNSYTYNLGLGGHLLGGNLSIRGSGSKREAVSLDQFRGRWSYPIYSGSLVKQVQVGDLSYRNTPVAESRSFQGINITNSPNAPRRYFDTIIFSDQLARGWDTELHINRHFKDYATSSEEHSFHFTAPLKYGSNLIQLKHYDTNGFNRQEEYLIHIPHEFLPPGKLEYDLTAGRYSNYTDRYFGRMNLTWGFSSNLTIGGGSLVESMAKEKQILPFIQSWFRPGKHIIIRGGHTLNRLSRGSFRMAFPGSQSLMLDIKKYYRQDKWAFNKTGKSLEASLNTTFPVRLPLMNFSASLSSRYIKSQSDNHNLYIYSGISTSLPLGIHLRANSRLMFRNYQRKALVPSQVTTRVNLTKRLFRNLMFRPELEYSHSRDKIRASELSLRYRITSDINMDFSFHRDHLLNNSRFQFSLRMDLPFARHTSSVRFASNATTLYQNTGGSIHFNDSNRSFDFDRRRKLGKASLTLNPFMDYNHNAQQDSDEPSVDGITVDIYRKDKTKPLYRNLDKADNLIPYERYLVRINDAGLGNPLLKPRHPSYSVQVLPNSSNLLPIPIIATGEAAGKVKTTTEEADPSVLDGLEIRITSGDSGFSEAVQTFWGGSFYYVGLTPGTYTAALDHDQLENRSLKAVDDSITFTIEPDRDGDIVDGLSLGVAPQEFTPGSSDSVFYAIQIGAFKRKENALGHAALSRVKTGYDITVIYDAENDIYKSRFGSFDSKQQALKILHSLKSRGADVFGDAFIIEVQNTEDED